MNDAVIARIRTWWPMFLGHIAAILVAWLARSIGIQVDSLVIVEGLGLVLSAGIWELGRKLEDVEASPAAQTAGRWLLAFGAAVGPPTYQQPATPDGTATGGPAD